MKSPFSNIEAIFNEGIADGFSVNCYTRANAVTLPVELLFFRARIVNENQVFLNSQEMVSNGITRSHWMSQNYPAAPIY